MRRMALLRNLEQSLSGLVEGTVGRIFRNEVRPTEIARKLAREMEINKRVSLSRTYAPTDYLIYLSAEDRQRYAGVEDSIAEELSAYLLEHARRERLVLVRRPVVEFHTDQRLHFGEFGIEARTAPVSAADAPARKEPARPAEPARSEDRSVRRPRREPAATAESGVPAAPVDWADPKSVDSPWGDLAPEPPRAPEPPSELIDDPYADSFSGGAGFGGEDAPFEQPDSFGRPAAAPGPPWIDPTLRSRPEPEPERESEPEPPARPLAGGASYELFVDGARIPLTGDHVVLGRSRSCDVVVADASVSRQHAELRCDDQGWYIVDLGSTNGTELNGRILSSPQRIDRGSVIRLGHAPARLEVR